MPTEEAYLQSAITRTCRQVRAEFLPIFYAANLLMLGDFCYTRDYTQQPHPEAFEDLCNEPQPRPADSVKAIGYNNLRHVQRISLSGDNGFCRFHLALQQDIKKRTLTMIGGFYKYVGREFHTTQPVCPSISGSWKWDPREEGRRATPEGA